MKMRPIHLSCYSNTVCRVCRLPKLILHYYCSVILCLFLSFLRLSFWRARSHSCVWEFVCVFICGVLSSISILIVYSLFVISSKRIVYYVSLSISIYLALYILLIFFSTAYTRTRYVQYLNFSLWSVICSLYTVLNIGLVRWTKVFDFFEEENSIPKDENWIWVCFLFLIFVLFCYYWCRWNCVQWNEWWRGRMNWI